MPFALPAPACRFVPRLLTLGVTLCLAASAGVARADIYKYVDENGRITYSNVPIKGANKLDLGVYNSIPAPRHKGSGASSAAAPRANVNPGPADFPSVDIGTQRKRDSTRRGILDNELAGEEKLLADTRRAYDDGQAARTGEDAAQRQVRLGKLREAVSNHEANIQAIKKELRNTR